LVGISLGTNLDLLVVSGSLCLGTNLDLLVVSSRGGQDQPTPAKPTRPAPTQSVNNGFKTILGNARILNQVIRLFWAGCSIKIFPPRPTPQQLYLIPLKFPIFPQRVTVKPTKFKTRRHSAIFIRRSSSCSMNHVIHLFFFVQAHLISYTNLSGASEREVRELCV
jgi:hypothetical protein